MPYYHSEQAGMIAWKNSATVRVDWDFSLENISRVKFSRDFIFVVMTTRRTKLTLFIHKRKYFAGLIFVCECDRRKFFHDENLPIYDIHHWEHLKCA